MSDARQLGMQYLAQPRGVLGYDGLQRREHSSLEQVASACRPVLQAEHDVRVQDGAVLALSDIADQREQFALLRHLDTAVVPGRPVEPADGGVLERADGGDLRGLQLLRAGELGQRRDRLIARIAYDDVSDNVRVLDDLDFIASSSARREAEPYWLHSAASAAAAHPCPPLATALVTGRFPSPGCAWRIKPVSSVHSPGEGGQEERSIGRPGGRPVVRDCAGDE